LIDGGGMGSNYVLIKESKFEDFVFGSMQQSLEQAFGWSFKEMVSLQ